MTMLGPCCVSLAVFTARIIFSTALSLESICQKPFSPEKKRPPLCNTFCKISSTTKTSDLLVGRSRISFNHMFPGCVWISLLQVEHRMSTDLISQYETAFSKKPLITCCCMLGRAGRQGGDVVRGLLLGRSSGETIRFNPIPVSLGTIVSPLVPSTIASKGSTLSVVSLKHASSESAMLKSVLASAFSKMSRSNSRR